MQTKRGPVDPCLCLTWLLLPALHGCPGLAGADPVCAARVQIKCLSKQRSPCIQLPLPHMLYGITARQGDHSHVQPYIYIFLFYEMHSPCKPVALITLGAGTIIMICSTPCTALGVHAKSLACNTLRSLAAASAQKSDQSGP